MKRLFVVLLVLAFCIPASAELVIYKATCRERLLDQAQDCPAKEVLTETMWLIIEVDPEELALSECGDSIDLSEAAIFKKWKLGRQKLYDYDYVGLMYAYVLDDHVCVWMQYCDATCVIFGPMSKVGLPRVLVGHMILDGQYIGEGTCSVRLDTRLMKMAYEEEWSIEDVTDYLEVKEGKKAEPGDMCDPLYDEIDS